MNDVIWILHDTDTKKEAKYHKYEYLFGQDVRIKREYRYFSPILSRPLHPVRSDIIRGRGHISEEFHCQLQNKCSPCWRDFLYLLAWRTQRFPVTAYDQKAGYWISLSEFLSDANKWGLMNHIFKKWRCKPLCYTCVYTGKGFQKNPSEKESVDEWATSLWILVTDGC